MKRTLEGAATQLVKRTKKPRLAPCTCVDCGKVSAVATESRALPNRSSYLLLRALTPCPHAGVSYRRALRQVLPEATLELDEDSVYEASTDNGEEEGEDVVVPDWNNLMAWRNVKDYSAAQRLFTPHSVALNFHPHPRWKRLRIDFENGKHDYYWDDILVNKQGDKNAWPSPSKLIHWVFKPFEKDFRAQTTAKSQLRGLFDERFFTKADYPDGKKPTLEVLWDMFTQRQTDARRTLLWESIRALFVTSVPVDMLTPLQEQPPPDFLPRLTDLLVKEILAQWDASRNTGSAKHAGFDAWLQHEPLPEGLTLPLGFVRCMVKYSKQYDVFGTEVPLADEFGHVVGCADLILIDRVTGELLLADFKNVKDEDLKVAGNPTGKGTHPFTIHMADTKYNHYRIQLSIYRDILNRLYFPGRFVNHLLLLNFRPSEPEGFQDYWMEPLDLAPLWKLLPWQWDDPRHKEFPLGKTLVVPIPDSDPRCEGPTTRIRVPRDGTELAADVVWTGSNYLKPKQGPVLHETIWKPIARWFGDPPAGTAEQYEEHLLNSPALLAELPKVIGKRVACWCFKKEMRCHADVIVKYCNLLHHGAFEVPISADVTDSVF